MSDNKPYNLNITFKYKYFDKKLQKYVNYDYNILENGKFLHSDIRNQNFYDNIIDKNTKKRAELLTKYKNAISTFNSTLKNKENLDLYDEIQK